MWSLQQLEAIAPRPVMSTGGGVGTAARKLTEAVPGQTRVGWIGTGVMGLAMCDHVLNAGFTVTVYNRTSRKADPLCKKGAILVESPRAVAERSDVVFTMLGTPSEVREVILGTNGVLKGFQKTGIVVDTTSSEPSLARDIFETAQAMGHEAVDAPVSGGDKGAKDGTLTIFAGGHQETVSSLRVLFNCFGSVTYLGPAGCGQSCKLANQITYGLNILGLSEGILFARKAGLDVSTYLKAISAGAAGSKALDLFADRIVKQDFSPGGFADYQIKDLGIALSECQAMGVSLPGLGLAQQLYVSMKAHGDGKLGSHALIRSLERLNNVPTAGGQSTSS